MLFGVVPWVAEETACLTVVVAVVGNSLRWGWTNGQEAKTEGAKAACGTGQPILGLMKSCRLRQMFYPLHCHLLGQAMLSTMPGLPSPGLQCVQYHRWRFVVQERSLLGRPEREAEEQVLMNFSVVMARGSCGTGTRGSFSGLLPSHSVLSLAECAILGSLVPGSTISMCPGSSGDEGSEWQLLSGMLSCRFSRVVTQDSWVEGSSDGGTWGRLVKAC